jgi:hypothetical protein
MQAAGGVVVPGADVFLLCNSSLATHQIIYKDD